jgi:5-methylcytosine-specific restriction endonuclease McrA
MDSALRAAVRDRASDCYEYCQRSKADSPLLAMQIEHVLPRKHGGDDRFDNLAWVCARCNLHRGSDLTGIDPDTNTVSPLFNPRTQKWSDHFQWHQRKIVGLTAIGRATIRVLQLNSPARMRVRWRTWRQ